MKIITKLQSYTDVITNSSSTVFIMHKDDAEFYEKDTPNNCCSIEEMIEKNGIKNVAFGAHFIKNLRDSKIKTWLYDEQSFSKNIILTKDLVQITPSSFDLNPIMKIEL